MDKKEISDKKIVRAFIIGFISYSLVFFFLIIIALAFSNLIATNLHIEKNFTSTLCNSIFWSLLIYLIMLFLCRINTVDIFKKFKIDSTHIDNIMKKLKIFFISCAVLSFILCITSATLNLKNSNDNLEKIKQDYYKSYSAENIEIANKFINDTIIQEKSNISNYSISIAIVEGTVLFSFLYLICYQRKMILEYNGK